MGAGEQKSKAAKLAAAMAGNKKGKKKKWSKGKVKEKKNNLALFMQGDGEDGDKYEQALVSIPKMKTITIAVVSERLKVRGSLARKLIRLLSQRGEIRKITDERGMCIYTKQSKDEDEE